MNEITRLLEAVDRGEAQAAARLLPLVYDELRRLAAQKLAREKPGQTLQATALVHEAYLRMVNPGEEQLPAAFGNRRYFFAAAAEAMRRILVDNARRKQSEKHGGGWQRHDAEQVDIFVRQPREDLLALNEALEKLGSLDPQAAELVQLRYFAGLSIPEVAEVLDVAPRTADRLWAYAKAFLHQELRENLDDMA
jgi:RNA polymerase sigma factor (TIGR02999 family)